jgi:nascent polypeptide-associated complex subunit alpha
MHKRMNPREQKRMMQRMGMNMDSVPDVQQVIIRTAGKDIVIDEPEVAILAVQGQKMYQVIGGQVSEQAPSARLGTAAPAKPSFSEEDVQLVADQTGKSLDKAREALQEADAVLILIKQEGIYLNDIEHMVKKMNKCPVCIDTKGLIDIEEALKHDLKYWRI